MAQTKIQKKYKLDLKGVPLKDRAKAKADVAEYLEEEIQVTVASGKSPVEGESFKRLSKKYADEHKDGDRTPNLFLDGDLMDSLRVEPQKGNEVLISVSEDQNDKADGHCNFSGRSKLPRRRFIPGKDQGFKKDIENTVRRIVSEYAKQELKPAKPIKHEAPVIEDPNPVSFSFDVKTMILDELGLELDEYLDGQL